MRHSKIVQMQHRILELELSYQKLRLNHRKTKRAHLALARRLKRNGFELQRSMHIIAPRLIAVLLENRELRIRERQLFLFMLRFALGYVSQDELKQHLQNKLPAGELTTLYSYMTGRSPRKRVRALIVIFYLYGVPRESIATGLAIHVRTIKKYVRAYKRSGVEAVFPRQKRAIKWADPKYKEALFGILYSPPKAFAGLQTQNGRTDGTDLGEAC